MAESGDCSLCVGGVGLFGFDVASWLLLLEWRERGREKAALFLRAFASAGFVWACGRIVKMILMVKQSRRDRVCLFIGGSRHCASGNKLCRVPQQRCLIHQIISLFFTIPPELSIHLVSIEIIRRAYYLILVTSLSHILYRPIFYQQNHSIYTNIPKYHNKKQCQTSAPK